MEEAPCKDRTGGDEQTEDLIAAIGAALLVAARLLGLLLEIGFDLGLHHGSV